ncbi:MAG: glutamine synthetase III [Firmicutes bacterium]|nr:glutamine synthetase III [Bacillota bacterium]
MDKTLKELYGSMVFDEATMQEHLSARTFASWKDCVKEGKTLGLDAAEEMAEAMKQWAISLGATHYTHWFQPMTGATAEKHDSFIDTDGMGGIVMKFSGKELVKGEPDASSFPSGGLRSTFEARGYTAWDPTSYAFVKDNSLYIPTIFCSYSGQALDKKMPLLRSMEAVNKQALRILRLFGDTETQKVTAQVGPEQEYFLIDKKLYNAREDLRLTGRTLFGADSPRGQEMEDHYFGMIKPRVADFMQELDEELWKVGVPSKTKHNEVAPSQHEMAAIYSDANTACDHNQLAMELLKKVADKHGFACLIHEKPFAGVNGSGKHDNWSLATDTGKNLFKPGSTPEQNLQFLVFLAAFVKGVDEYQGVLRASIATSANDHRLGAQEAPPAVMSIFLGDELAGVVESIIEGRTHTSAGKRMLDIGVNVLPNIRQDNTDRNRTSPMAFTGNKFEFRMVGSSDSISGPNIILNTMMAEELKQFADELEGKTDLDAAAAELIKRVFTDHSRIIFEGNGYDDAWLELAEKRGLKNLKTTPDALPELVADSTVDLLVGHGIYKPEEVHARYIVYVEKYTTEILIEARTMVDMIEKDILPSVSSYLSELCSRVKLMSEIGIAESFEKGTAAKIAGLLSDLKKACTSIEDAIASVPSDDEAAMYFCRDTIIPAMNDAREAADTLETLVDRRFWPFPTYSELLFSER